MENSHEGISAKTKLKAVEMLKIANEAVLKAREKSYALGLPSSFWMIDRVGYELPDGRTITDIKSETNL